MSIRAKTFCINLALMCGAGILIVNPFVVGRILQFADWTAPAYILGVDLFLAAIAVCCILYVRHLHARYFYIALAAVALLPVLMVITELGLTYIYLSDHERWTVNQIHDVHQPDPVLGWTLAPDRVGRHYSAGNYEVSYDIDSLGRRSTRPNSTAEKRMLFFGDSFIFGQGVENEETALYLLAKSKHEEFKVLNYAVMGYSLEQMYMRFRSVIDEVASNDVVVFAPMSEDLSRNLITKNHACKFSFRGSEIETLPVLRDHEWRSVRLQDECGFLETLALNSHKYLFGKVLYHYRKSALIDEIIDNADAILAQASKLARGRRAVFVVLFLANPKECARRTNEIDLSRLRTPFLSLLPYCPEDSDTLERLGFSTDYHWSPFGNRWAAQAIEKVLDDALSTQ